MKASDIPDDELLALVAAVEEYKGGWANIMEIADLLGVPEKVVRAKVRKLLRRDLMDGCSCGCRGDLVVIDRYAPPAFPVRSPLFDRP